MANGDFTEVFGGNNIAPAGPTYLSLVPMAADVTLEWPIEQAITDLVVANIIDVSATVPGLAIHLPSAIEAGTGYTSLFNNIGAQNVNVEDSLGSVIVSLAPGTVWQIYLTDNSTAAGSWRVFQFGASVSTAVAAALAGSGLTAKGTQLATNWVVTPQGGDYIIVDADRAKVERYTGGVGTFTLPLPATVGAGWFVGIKNSGSGNLTLAAPGGGSTIDGSATVTFAPSESGLVVTDGNNFFVLFHGGGSGGTGFSYIVINAAGSGNIVLAGAQLNQIGYRFTGVLTGNRHIVVPNTAQEYWVDNETTGAFTFDVGTAAQIAGPGGVIIPQGNQKILQCDGTNVLPGDSTSVSFPISIANGGTNATTAANARTNLGASTVGNAVFTAASAAAAQAALSVPPNSRLISTGNGLVGGGDLSADRTLTLDPLHDPGTYLIKPGDTARASTTVIANDPDLIITNLAPGTYEFEVHVYYRDPVLTGLKGAVNPTNIGFVSQYVPVQVANGPSLAGGLTMTSYNHLPGVSTVSSVGTDGGTWRAVFIAEVIAANSLAFTWAQNTSSGTPVTVKAGSYIRYKKLI